MIAVFGGSFDPPTLGHLMVVSHLLLNESDVTHVIVVPCLHQEGKNLTSYNHRMQMAQRTFGVLSRVSISSVEEDIMASETYLVLRELKRRHPNEPLRFVMGADLLVSAPTWGGWEEITEIAPPLVVGRAGAPNINGDNPTPICPVMSSSIVRKTLVEGDYKTVERYITRDTLWYIRAYELYQVIPQKS